MRRRPDPARDQLFLRRREDRAWDCPRYAGESWPGIQGGMRPSCVMTRMPFACACADFADRSENGAMPPGVWQPAHFSAKIGATSAHVGVAAIAGRRGVASSQGDRDDDHREP